MATQPKTQQAYDSTSIQTLRFPDDIRSSPGMFIGSTDNYGLWVLIREMLDNAIDEFLAGRGSEVHLHVQDGEYWVLDDANGIPQGVQKYVQRINGKDVTIKTPTLQAVFADLHTSGKFHTEAYKISRGTHGIGVKATNALSKFLNVYTFYEGQWYSIAFRKGKIVQDVAKCTAPKKWDGTTARKGTLLHMAPDLTIFSESSFPSRLTIEWAEIATLLSPGFKVIISSPKGRKEFLSDKGPSEYVTRFVEQHNLLGERLMFEFKSELADVIVGFTNYDGCSVRGFVNGLSQSQGGKHVESVTGALYAGLKPFIKMKKIKEDGKTKEVPVFRESDLKEGLVGLVNMYLHKATYSSQDKSKLSDDRAGDPFEQMLEEEARKFFSENKAMANRLCERAAQMNSLKQKFTLSKQAAKALNGLRRNGLPAKFASWDPDTKAKDRELYIVEGDSAGGTAKKARFEYQGILPLKGKIFNALKDTTGKTLESDEILNILAGIGYDVNATDPYAKLQVGKIICLADPDSDGCHINSLLLSLFYRYLPDLFERGMVYIANAPEFYSVYKGSLVYGNSLSYVQGLLQKKLKAPESTSVRHVKGYGELDEDMVRVMVMDPNTRSLIRIKAIEAEDRVEFVSLMNDDVPYRRKLMGIPDEEPVKTVKAPVNRKVEKEAA